MAALWWRVVPNDWLTLSVVVGLLVFGALFASELLAPLVSDPAASPSAERVTLDVGVLLHGERGWAADRDARVRDSAIKSGGYP